MRIWLTKCWSKAMPNGIWGIRPGRRRYEAHKALLKHMNPEKKVWLLIVIGKLKIFEVEFAWEHYTASIQITRLTILGCHLLIDYLSRQTSYFANLMTSTMIIHFSITWRGQGFSSMFLTISTLIRLYRFHTFISARSNLLYSDSIPV